MNLKLKNTRKFFKRGPLTECRVLARIPNNLVKELSGRQLGILAVLLEATYKDGYKAAGGNLQDTA